MILVLVMTDQVGDDLSIGFRLKDAAVRRKPFFQRKVVLDDAVVNDDNPTRLVTVRVSIFLGWPAVRRPTRVADAICTIERMQPNALFQVTKLPFRPPQFQMMLLISHGNTGRVVTA